jgi:hypothetical protein
MKKAITTALLLAVSLQLMITPAHAAGDRASSRPILASGSSPAGAPWRIELQVSSGGPSFNFSVGDQGATGHSIGLLLPIARNFGIGADAGTQVDPYAESDLSGIAGRRATKIAVTMSSGEVLFVAPALAPLRLRQRLPWLGRLRFFDLFFPAGEKPLRAKAFDHNDHPLAIATSEHGLFDSSHRP